MKKKKTLSFVKRLIAAILLCALFVTGLVAVTALADNVTDEMTDIKAAFDGNYLVQSTAEWTDKYVGKFEYTVYYDTAKGTPTIGYENTTPIILYTVNHPTAVKTGTDSNVSIIQSMLDRGYVVMVLDYLNTNASTEMLASSTQTFRQEISLGNVLKFGNYSGAKPWNHFVCPAGCNVLVDAVFWEIDKHSAEGTLDKIVQNWNTDLKTSKPNSYVKWATGDTVATRKKTTSDVVWYNANKQVDANGLYTQLKYTVAEKITDCVNPDGSFIDMNLYINIVYPTNPVKEVPVMSLANSSGQPRTSVATDSQYLRPHSNNFLYEGYANVVFDYLWMPMARNASFGYYDGSSGNTKDHMNYAVMMYNDKLVNTAAMRYLRHISEEKADVCFDLDAFGVYGNSKGGWFSFLGEEVVQSPLANGTYASTEEREEAINAALSAFVPDRYFDGHHGETRYQMGIETYTDSVSGFTVKGGEIQPWLTYKSGANAGKEIISGVQLTNATNGSQEEDMTKGHVPIFVVSNMQDDYNAAYSYSVNLYNICRELDIPMLQFELPIGHTLVEGNDMNYNVSSYDAYFKYIAYFLKGEAIDIAYISPMDKAGNTDLDTKIKIAFTGVAERSEVEKITVSLGGNAVDGIWESSFGGVTWEFTPAELLSGGSAYTVNIPADFCGDNGVAMGSAYTTSFITKSDKVSELAANGGYYTFTAPSEFTFGNGYAFRFAVSNDAANIAELYAVESTTATDGELLGSVNLRGAGTYEIDISDFIAANKGSEVTLLLKAKNAGGETVILDSPDGSAIYDNASKKAAAVFEKGATIAGETALSVYVSGTTKKPDSNTVLSEYYSNPTQIFVYSKIMGGVPTTAENYGRRFTVEFDIYDTVNRVILVNLNSMTKREAYGTIDYDNVYFNVSTKANEWVHVEFTYEIYESDYGFPSDTNTQSMALSLSPSGNEVKKAYINALKVTETVTDISVSAAGLAETDDRSGFAYSAPISDKPIALYNGDAKVGEYASLKDAFAAFVSGYTLKLQSDYTLDDSGVYSGIGGFAKVNLDLNGYTLTTANKTGALIYDKSASTAASEINISGGRIELGRTALISFADAVAANKSFDINFDGVSFSFAENSFATELVMASAIKSGASITADIDLTDCIFDLDDGMHSNDASVIFPAPASSALKVSYGITGGEIRLSSQRWVTVSGNASIVEFFADSSENYTTLIMPEAITKAPVGSYLMADGYAGYAKASSTSYMVTYTLVCDENSTRYGVINENYSSVIDHPFVVFSNGTLVESAKNLKLAVSAANKLLSGTQYSDTRVEILMRTDFDNSDEISFGGTNGTILIDLGGNALARTKTIINAVLNSNTVYDYPTSVVFTNGRINAKANSPIGVTHYLADPTKTKTFNITFDKVTFGFDGGFTGSSVSGIIWNFWQNGHKVNSVTNLTYKDCSFDLETNAPANGGTLITIGNTYADANIRILGGSFVTNGAAYTLAKTDSEDSLIAGIGSDGKLPALKVKTGGAAIPDNFKSADGEYTNFTTDGTTEGGYDIYTLTTNDNVTDYGVIPTAKADADAYPFILFSGGEYISAHATWKGAIEAARAAASSESVTVTVLLRRSYDVVRANDQSTNFNTAKGSIVVDLNGNTLDNKDNYTIDIYVNYSTANYLDYESRITFKNGTLKNSRNDSTDARPMIVLGHTETKEGATVKKYSFTFDNVIFEFGTNANAIIAEWNHSGQGLENTYTFNGCTLKFDGAASKAKAFDFADGNKKQKSVVNFNGGKIEASDFAAGNYTLVNGNDYDSVTFDKYEGKYTTLVSNTTVKDHAHYTGAFNTAEGKRYFVEVKDDGTKSTYELLPMSFGNLSAAVSAKYLSAVDYPFFVFEDTAFKSANTTWSAALGAARDLVKAEDKENTAATIVMRYDCLSTAGTNFNAARGKIVVDLNGYTLESNHYLVDCGVSYSSTATYLGYKSTIEIKNGTIVNSRTSASLPLFGLQHSGNIGTVVKAIDFYFTDVTFEYSNASKYTIAEFADKTGDGIILGYYFDNCTVDFTNAPSGASLADCDDSNGLMKSTLVFKGGSIIAPTLAAAKLANIAADDTVTYERKGGGQYTAIVLPSSAAAPTHTSFAVYNEDGQKLTLAKESISGTNTVYRLGVPAVTKYGEIPYTYADAAAYPFIVFNENGGIIAAEDSFLDILTPFNNDGAFNAAKAYMQYNSYVDGSYGDNPRAAVILMRRDYSMTADERYENFAQVQGTLTIDLGGYTLTAASGRTLMSFSIKPWGGSKQSSEAADSNIFPTEIIMKNGSAVIKNKTAVHFDAWTGDSTRPDDFLDGKEVSFKFIGVGFKVAGSTTSIISYSANSNTPNATANVNISYENCVFDLTSATAANPVTLFDSGNGKIHTETEVLGCEIKAASLDKFTLSSTDIDSIGAVTLGRSSDGKLLALTLNKGAEAPSGIYATTLGDAEFKKVSENALTETYKLTVKALSDFKVQTSISLYSDLRFNIYVTDIATLTRLTLNGSIYEGAELEALPKTELDGVSYYILTVSLPATSALGDIVLETEIAVDEDTLSGRYTMSLVEYVKAASDKVSSDEEDKLLSDILSYVRSAYAYSGNTDTDLAEIDNILGADYDIENMPDVGTAVKPEDGNGVESAAFVLGAVPSVRFYLDGTVTDTSKFRFTQGSKTLEFTSGTDADGDYLEVKTFAYVLAGEISFTVEGTSYSGSYNLASYYDFVVNEYNGEDKAELTALVERFMAYAQSAEAYRAYVIENQ